jgi:hypothetical protein
MWVACGAAADDSVGGAKAGGAKAAGAKAAGAKVDDAKEAGGAACRA